MSPLPDRQVPGVYHRKVGGILVTTLSDGYIDAPTEALQNIPVEYSAALLAKAFCPTRPRINVNAFLVRAGGRIALIEAGSGSTLGPTLGWLPRNLAAAGVDPASIDTVILTHMHPDHSNGLLADDGSLAFPNAEVVMHADEAAHWGSDANLARAEGRQKVYFETARQRLDAVRSHLRLIHSGEVVPGVEARPIPGHTPGHTAYLIASGRESLLIWGDIVHVPQVQIPRPEAGIAFDTDAAAAAATRRRVLDEVATDGVLVGGMHINFPGFAHIVRDGATYAMVPEVFQLAM